MLFQKTFSVTCDSITLLKSTDTSVPGEAEPAEPQWATRKRVIAVIDLSSQNV